MWANPLTYGVAALRRLIYWGASDAPLPPDLPGMTTCWLVTLVFAAAMFAAAWAVAGRRTTGDLL